MAAVRCKTAGFQWKQLFAVTKCSVTYPNSRLLRRLARVQTWPVSPIPTYRAFIPAYSNVGHVQKQAFVYVYTAKHRHVQKHIQAPLVTDGSCTHLPSFPRKWSQVDPPPPPETPLMTKLANFDQLGSYLLPSISSSLSLSPLHLLFYLFPSLPLSSLANSHSLSNARRIYLDR